MILIDFASILGQKRLKISKVIVDTKISRPTLTALYYDLGKGINFDTLNTLCGYLQVQPGDIIKFYPIDIDEINITYIDCDYIDDDTSFAFDPPQIADNILFHGVISFTQQHIVDLTFSGLLQKDKKHSYYILNLSWLCEQETFNQIIPYKEVRQAICEKIREYISTTPCPFQPNYPPITVPFGLYNLSFIDSSV